LTNLRDGLKLQSRAGENQMWAQELYVALTAVNEAFISRLEHGKQTLLFGNLGAG
jgi:hypothetical protein